MTIEMGEFGSMLLRQISRAAWLEPTPKRIRGIISGETLVDTTSALLLLEYGRMPAYYFPIADVRRDLLEESDKETSTDDRGIARYWNIRIGDRLEKNAAWCYSQAPAPVAHLANYITFKWRALDKWLEEEEEIFDHPRQPYHRVDILCSRREVSVEHDGIVLANTRNALFIYETGMITRYYIPEADINRDYLEPSDHHTSCPYKGKACYWHININGNKIKNAAWAYPDPLIGAERLSGHISFYNEKMDRITVDGKETPKQAGYGGAL